ncbi:MAG: hypothetical protein ACTSUE_05115 [Promethearchaeota archaeon]
MAEKAVGRFTNGLRGRRKHKKNPNREINLEFFAHKTEPLTEEERAMISGFCAAMGYKSIHMFPGFKSNLRTPQSPTGYAALIDSDSPFNRSGFLNANMFFGASFIRVKLPKNQHGFEKQHRAESLFKLNVLIRDESNCAPTHVSEAYDGWEASLGIGGRIVLCEYQVGSNKEWAIVVYSGMDMKTQEEFQKHLYSLQHTPYNDTPNTIKDAYPFFQKMNTIVRTNRQRLLWMAMKCFNVESANDTKPIRARQKYVSVNYFSGTGNDEDGDIDNEKQEHSESVLSVQDFSNGSGSEEEDEDENVNEKCEKGSIDEAESFQYNAAKEEEQQPQTQNKPKPKPKPKPNPNPNDPMSYSTMSVQERNKLARAIKWYPSDLYIPSEYVFPSRSPKHCLSDPLPTELFGYKLGQTLQRFLRDFPEHMQTRVEENFLNGGPDNIRHMNENNIPLRRLEYYPKQIRAEIETNMGMVHQNTRGEYVYYSHCTDVTESTNGVISLGSPRDAISILHPPMWMRDANAPSQRGWDIGEESLNAYPSMKRYYQNQDTRSSGSRRKSKPKTNSTEQYEHTLSIGWEDPEIFPNLNVSGTYDFQIPKQASTSRGGGSDMIKQQSLVGQKLSHYDYNIPKINILCNCQRVSVRDLERKMYPFHNNAESSKVIDRLGNSGHYQYSSL